MASRNERFVGIFEFSVRVARQPDHPIKVEVDQFEVLQIALLQARIAEKRISKKMEEDNLIIILDDMKIDKEEQIACLLFTVIDVDVADTVYRNVKSGYETVYKKGPDDGGAASAHLVINLKAETNVFRYRAGLEDIEGIPRSRIQPFLQELFRTHVGQVQTVIDYEGFIGDAVIEFQSLHKDKLTDAAGRPVSVDLVHLERRQTHDGAGEERYRERKATHEFSINRKQSLSDALAALFDIRKRQKEEFKDFPLMRVRWKRDDGRTQTLRVDNLADDLMQRAFTRLELVTGFKEDLAAATKVIRQDLFESICKLVSSK